MRVKKSDFVLAESFGALYLIGSFRDSSGTVWEGINGKDGITYNVNTSEIERKLTREEFDRAIADQIKAADQF